MHHCRLGDRSTRANIAARRISHSLIAVLPNPASLKEVFRLRDTSNERSRKHYQKRATVNNTEDMANMATTTTALVTTAQFLAQPEQYDAHGNRIKDELIGGEIVLLAPPSRIHDLIKNRINQALVLFLAQHPSLGLLVNVEIAFAITDQDMFVPDVRVVRESRIREGTLRILTRAPEIAIEIVSPRDTAAHVKAKIAAYLGNGSQSVWVVYPDDRSALIHAAESVREVKGDQPLEDALLPGVSAPISRFFEGL